MSKFDPQNAQNLVEIEKQFAVVAVEQAQTYWNLLASVEPKDLRLTKLDDEIFEHLKAAFPELVQEPYDQLKKIDENFMKNESGKKRWHEFILQYEKTVKDYNFGSLIRVDADDEYSQTNSIFVTRLQFYAIEIARNRLGLNDVIHEKAKKEAEAEKAAKAKEKEKADKKRKKAD
ncbi:hypothetical protein M422DRAFT_32259 [Sphaerobolus stellatus SS14]|uniref:Polysaccharide biosynthesis domain-containing protein n=1 Tax=Sphaerobolus stellatus (strain SS14) TaxID=990650 RepID=A0A0C9V005_SPHS4|nr:hypothetical protein M422DRAFT_32259 [Sphaerobolus stellatus SS14]